MRSNCFAMGSVYTRAIPSDKREEGLDTLNAQTAISGLRLRIMGRQPFLLHALLDAVRGGRIESNLLVLLWGV